MKYVAKSHGRRASRRAFSIVDILVVIAILAILAAQLFPVFIQARDKAQAMTALSNARQIGAAFQMYAQDWDEGLPLTSHSAGSSWINSLQPYSKTPLLTRAPGDRSANWETPLPGESKTRRSSYAINAYLTPGGGFASLPAVRRPAECVYIVELKENKTGDHIHPMSWRRSSTGRGIDPKTEIETQRYRGGAHYVFVDGHARWHRFAETWHPEAEPQNLSSGIDWYHPEGR